MKSIIFLTAMLSVFTISFGQFPDVSFDADGERTLPGTFGSFVGEQQTIGLQSDGKIIIAGYYKFDEQNRSFAAMRLNPDGSTDNSFGSLGVKIINFEGNSEAYLVAIQPDNKIILAGIHQDGGKRYMVITRLEPNSAQDLTFGIKSFQFGGPNGFYNGFSSLAIQPDGKILAGGHGDNIINNGGIVLMRFNPDGSLDPGFGNNGIYNDPNYSSYSVNSCQVQTDGKIVAIYGLNASTSRARIVRFNSNGTIDAGFGNAGSQVLETLNENTANVLALQPDGKIVIVGSTYAYTDYPGGLSFWMITRLNTDGSFDNSFGTAGKKAISFGTVIRADATEANAVIILPNGKLIVGGYKFENTVTHSRIYRLTPSGSLDTNFGDEGKFDESSTGIGGMVLQADGKLVYSRVSQNESFVKRLVLLKKPVITCPGNINVSPDANQCSASVSFEATSSGDPDPSVVYKIGNTIITSPHTFPSGVTAVDVTASNGLLPDATCSFTVTVKDETPPIITNESASVAILSPANHAMRNVFINYTITDNCPVTATLTVTSNEPINGVGDGDTDPDWVILDNHNVLLRAERSAAGNGRIYTITISADDGNGNTSSKTVEVRVPHNIKNPRSGQPFVINSTVNFGGEFWDKPTNSHTAKWLIDGNTIANGLVTPPTASQNGKVTGSYKFTSAGVYKLQMNVTDQLGQMNYSNTNGDLDATVVIYDPNGGATYGGGWFPSLPGALAGTQASGKASYGFAVNYRNAAKPKGETQFEFKVGGFEFNALNFDYLVVSGYKAQFRGTGRIIGGQSGINFIMTVTDGRLDGTGVNKIRLKIYRNNGQVIYDNQPGASDAEDPIQPVGENSIIYVDGIPPSPSFTQSKSIIQEETILEDNLSVSIFPNPSDKGFNLLVKPAKTNERILLQVFDNTGKEIKTGVVKHGITSQLGRNYKAGIYFVKITQGNRVKTMKLVKL